MWISRIRVTGGFLSGLDVSLERGLNVIVGPRGAGKTTFLELLRHALGAQHPDQSLAATRGRQAFLEAVLGAGEIVLDVETDDGGRHLVVDAKGAGQRPDLSTSVLVLGQNEIEEIASDAASRLNLLDLRADAPREVVDRSEIGEITGELFDLNSELAERFEDSFKRDRLLADRELLASQEAALIGGGSRQLAEKRALLRDAEEGVLSSGQDLQRIESIAVDIQNIRSLQRREFDRLHVTTERTLTLPQAPLVREFMLRAASHLQDVESALSKAASTLELAEREARARNVAAREAAAPIREELEQAEAGLGQITAQLRNVDAALRHLDENDDAIHKLQLRYANLRERRAALLDLVERTEEELYSRRAEVARLTTAQVANNVVVVVDHLADSDGLRSFLQDALKGSNTRTSLIDMVADRVLPRQLLEMVESNDLTDFAAVVEVSPDRAQRFLENLEKKEILQGLAKVRLNDRVDFRLRDGSIDKSVDSLSTGQKCAVTLPIVLSERERILILDQPEDHLDNAFLVNNIVSGLVSRRDDGAQTIVATHNANIPVLGAAENVVVLRSDGRVGRPDVQGPFDADSIVDSITALMEGGREAFARRSAFYSAHGGLH